MQSNSAVNEALNSLKSARLDLQNQLRSVEQAISYLEKSMNESKVSNDPSKYDEDWTIADKFLFLLKRENRFLHFREAGEYIVDLEGKGDAKDVASKLTTGTTQLKNSNTIVKHQATNKLQDTFWGSPKWVDENGTIKKGHEYNPKYLASVINKKATIFDI